MQNKWILLLFAPISLFAHCSSSSSSTFSSYSSCDSDSCSSSFSWYDYSHSSYSSWSDYFNSHSDNHHYHHNHHHSSDVFDSDYFDSLDYYDYYDDFAFDLDPFNNVGELRVDENREDDLGEFEDTAQQIPFLPRPEFWLRRAKRAYADQKFNKCLRFIRNYEISIIAQARHFPGVITRRERAIITAYRKNCKKFLKEESYYSETSISDFYSSISYSEFESYYDELYAQYNTYWDHISYYDEYYYSDRSEDITINLVEKEIFIPPSNTESSDMPIVEALIDMTIDKTSSLNFLNEEQWKKFSDNVDLYGFVACGIMQNKKAQARLINGLVKFENRKDKYPVNEYSEMLFKLITE